MPHIAEMTSYRRHLNAVVTITDTPTSILDLIASKLEEKGVNPREVMRCVIMPKVAAGTDRGAIRIGDAAADMNLYFGAGILANPRLSESNWFVERVGGSDVEAVVLIGLS